jgi:lytic murein transglycosylase
MRIFSLKAVAAMLAIAMAAPAIAAPCQNITNFDQWLADFKKEALAQGISQQALDAAAPNLAIDPGIIKRDRGQAVFSQTFLQFSDRMVAPYRMQNGAAQIKKNADLFARIEKDFGVPPQVLTAFWGLESDFGTNNGKYNILRSLTTLASDCRRPDFFRKELLDALRIMQSGDQKPADMIGDWAGEFGGMQITASDYLKNAVDYDGDGRRDLIKSTPDTLASAANFLKNLGWQRGQPWIQEVRVPAELKWEEADLAIQHPRSQWIAWGVTPAYESTPPTDDLPASLILPMGRFGPAFLAYPNFKVFLGWNSAMVYSTTVAYFASRLAGAPPVGRGSGQVVPLTSQQIADLQRLLTKRGFAVGEIDGKFGNATRIAVKQTQLKLGLPADSYPTIELLDKLRGQTIGASSSQ